MKHCLALGLLFAAGLLLCGAQPAITSEEAAKQYSQKLCRVFFEGDYGKFRAMLPESLQTKFSPLLYQLSLDELKKSGPSHLPMQYLATLRRPGMILLLWKVEYQTQNCELLDRLASTSFTVADGRWTLTGFRFL